MADNDDSYGHYGEFEGDPVLAVQMVIRNTGDGLSNAMEINPIILHRNDEVMVVVKGHVIDVQHPGIDKTDGVARKQIVKATSALVLDGRQAEEMARRIMRQDEKVQRKREREAGVLPLPGTADDEDDD